MSEKVINIEDKIMEKAKNTEEYLKTNNEYLRRLTIAYSHNARMIEQNIEFAINYGICAASNHHQLDYDDKNKVFTKTNDGICVCKKCFMWIPDTDDLK